MSFGTWGVDPDRCRHVIESGRRLLRLRQRQVARGQPASRRIQPLSARSDLRDEKSTTDVQDADGRVGGQGSGAAGRPTSGASSMPTTPISTPPRSMPRGWRLRSPICRRSIGATTLADLARAVGHAGLCRRSVGGGVSVDAKQPDALRRVSSASSGLGLPDRDYYLDDSEKGREIQAKYREYLAFLLGEAGYEDPEGRGRGGLCIRRPHRADHRMGPHRAPQPRPDLQRAERATNSARWRRSSRSTPCSTAIGLADRTGLRRQPDAADAPRRSRNYGLTDDHLAKIGGGLPGDVGAARRDAARDAAGVIVRRNSSTVMRPSCRRRSTRRISRFYGKMLRGTPEAAPRWKRAIGAAEGQLGELIGASYVRALFPAREQGGDGRTGRQPEQGDAANIQRNRHGWARKPRSRPKPSWQRSTPRSATPTISKTYDGLDDRCRTIRSPTDVRPPSGKWPTTWRNSASRSTGPSGSCCRRR